MTTPDRSLSGSTEAGSPCPELDRQPWLICWTLAQMGSGTDGAGRLEHAQRSENYRDGVTDLLQEEEADFVAARHPGLRRQLQDWVQRGAPLPATAMNGLRELAILSSTWEGNLLRQKTAAEFRADRLILRWAKHERVHRQTRHALAECLLRQRHGREEVSWQAPPSSRDRESRCWPRLAQAGLLEALADGAANADGVRCSEEWNRRLCRLIDRIQGDDFSAFLVATHGDTGLTPALARVHAMQDLLAFSDGLLDRGRMEPGTGAVTPSEHSPETVETAVPPIDWGSSPDGLPSFPSQGSPSAGALSPGLPSMDPMNLPSIGTWSASARQASGPEAEVATPRDDDIDSLLSMPIAAPPLHLPSGPTRLARLRASAALAPLLFSPRVHAHDRRSPHGASPNLPSLASLQWLPSPGSIAPQRKGACSGFVPNMIQQIPSQVLTREEVATTLDLLDDEGNFAATPLDETWRRSAIQVLKSRASLTALDRGVTLSKEEESLMLEGIARSMRTAIGLATKEDGKENATQRGEEEMAAMEKLVAWVRAAGRGTEAIRREHWYALIGDQRYTPHATFRLSARMLAHGVALPPWSATRPLRAEDRHPDRGTLVWRGEPLVSDPAMTRMLDALGVRNLDLNVPDLNAGSGRVLPEALALEGISVATLGGTGSLGQEAMETLLERLGEELPGLYLVRLTGTDACRTTIALPPPWTRTSDPGLLVHADRNANRQRLDPLRGLWPGRSLPPAFRARAMNVHPGGEAVLELLGTVRNQRSSDTRFKKQDPGLALLLEPIIGGLAEDADFARRCEPLAKMPDGPCSDGGFSTLQAMVAMRDLRQAGSLQEVALHTLTIACKQRIDAWVGESRPGFNENLESAMVLRWFMTQLLREILGTDQIRLADKPMFGGAAEGEDWDSPERHSQFRRVALRLIAAEASDGFPGIVAMMAREKDAMGELTQARLDEEPELRALAARSEALREACNHGNPEDVRRTKAALGTIDAQRGEMRMALLQPLLAPMREQVLDAARRATQPPAGDDGPPAKRPRS